MLYEVVPLKIFQNKSDLGLLTYSSKTPLKIGSIVQIPFGKSTTTGIITKKTTAQVDFKVKPITKILYQIPLPKHLQMALFWLSQYYQTPLPQIANLILPSGIQKKRRQTSSSQNISSNQPVNTKTPALNAAQKFAIAKLASIQTKTKLLHGITGSGKTNIYLHLAQNAISAQKSVLLLVPEISLTSQLVQIFTAHFGQNIILMHSKQTESERHQIWQNILQSKQAQIVIGPRSALFAPLQNLGLIIIDEAHEPAYFQESPPKYSALRLASFIANQLKIDCLLGTATPLIQDYYLADRNHSLVSLSQKAIAANPPQIHLIDFKDRANFSKNRYFSNALLAQIAQNLENQHQTLIFHNRRGSAPLTICENCGWQALCPHCFLPLTLHSDRYQLVCHTCGYHSKVPSSCPSCGHLDVIHKGFGTKLLESELKKLFKSAKIARFDADNSKSSSLDQLYDSVKTGAIDILIGTQTIARGLDLPHLATVGVVQADAGLSLPDFAAEERSFHLLTQVFGRVGRGHTKNSHIFIQTFQPEHPVIKAAIQSDYSAFYQYLLKKRQKSKLPPFYFLAKLYLTYKTEQTTVQNLTKYHQKLSQIPHLIISPPTPAFHERTPRGYTWQIILKAKSRNTILQAINSLPPNPNSHFILDPPSLL